MRWLLAVSLLAGCASMALDDATERAEMCEARAPGQCGAYWQAVAEERQDLHERRRAVGAALMSNAVQPYQPIPVPQPIRCYSTRNGGNITTTCY